MRKTTILVLTAIIGLMLHAPSSHAAVTFEAGSVQVAPSGSVNVPITVSGFTDVIGFQFTL